MDYQTVEQLWCKITASADWLSQLACYAHFEQQIMPPAKWQSLSSTTVDQSNGGALAVIALLLLLRVLVSARWRPVLAQATTPHQTANEAD